MGDDVGYRLAGKQSQKRKGSAGVPPAVARPSWPRTRQRYKRRNAYGTQSPIKIFVSCGALALRFDAHTNFFPSGENMGKPSNPSL